MKTLIVYYTHTHNTELVAETLKKEFRADSVELKTKEKKSMFTQVLQCLFNREPEIRDIKLNPAKYDLIIVGTPVWCAKPVAPIRTFLKSLEAKDRKVVLYCTMSSSGHRKCLADMEHCLGKSTRYKYALRSGKVTKEILIKEAKEMAKNIKKID